MEAAGGPGTQAPRPAGRERGTLRLGLVVESLDVPRWVRAAVEQIAARGHARIALVVVDERSPSAGAPRSLYVRLERRFARAAGPDALAASSLRDLVDGAVVHHARAARAAALPEDVTAALRAADLDVVVNLGRMDVPGEVLA